MEMGMETLYTRGYFTQALFQNQKDLNKQTNLKRFLNKTNTCKHLVHKKPLTEIVSSDIKSIWSSKYSTLWPPLFILLMCSWCKHKISIIGPLISYSLYWDMLEYFMFWIFFSDNDLTDKDAEALCKIIQVEQSIKLSKLATHKNNNNNKRWNNF